MIEVVGIRFKPVGKIYYFKPPYKPLKEGDAVIVENSHGLEFGKVVFTKREMDEEDVVLPLQKVMRKATPADIDKVIENESREKEAVVLAKERIKKRKLDMQLVDVEIAFDRHRMIFYFTAEGRIDFRQLVKDLAAVFRTRIELRQIGVRDEAKLLGGIGPCGRMLCCSTFLGDFEPVSIKMAKDQNLSLNPTKISGLCGRLMCCLKYENDTYEEAKKAMPDVGRKLVTAAGKGRVTGLNMLQRIVQVKLEDNAGVVEYSLEELIEMKSIKG